MEDAQSRLIDNLLRQVQELKERRVQLLSQKKLGHVEKVNVAALISACVDLAERAGGIIRDIWWSGDLGAIEKGGGLEIDGARAEDPQTIADRKSEELIISTLMKHFPGSFSLMKHQFLPPSCTSFTRTLSLFSLSACLPPRH